MELINILIRTCCRRDSFLRCIASIQSQSYPNLRVIVSADRDGIDYIPDWCETIRVTPSAPGEYYYDAYINDLKARVNEGWFFILDDDDVLAPGCLNQLKLNAPAILVQINYMGRVLPNVSHGIINDTVIKNTGFPCLVLHHSLAKLHDITPTNQLVEHNDQTWIRAIHSLVGLTFQEIVLVVVDKKGDGRS